MLTFSIDKQTSAQQGKIMSGEDKCMIDNMDLLGSSPLPWSVYKDCAEHLGSYVSRTSHSVSFSMYSLHLLLRASPAVLLLILCLQLGTTKAQEDTWAKTFSSSLKMWLISPLAFTHIYCGKKDDINGLHFLVVSIIVSLVPSTSLLHSRY